jgi:hypothetical protein
MVRLPIDVHPSMMVRVIPICAVVAWRVVRLLFKQRIDVRMLDLSRSSTDMMLDMVVRVMPICVTMMIMMMIMMMVMMMIMIMMNNCFLSAHDKLSLNWPVHCPR